MPRVKNTQLNRRGPGRTLDNGFRRLAFLLEVGVGKLAYHAGLGPYAKAERTLSIFDVDDLSGVRVGEKECSLFLGNARSYNPAIQLMAFLAIICLVAASPSHRLTFRRCLGSKYTAQTTIQSWKRHNIFYNRVWKRMHELVSRCLSCSHESNSDIMTSFLELKRHGDWNTRVDFSEFAKILDRCKDIHDYSLTIEFMACGWNGEGLLAYVEECGFRNSILYNCAKAIERGLECAFEFRKLKSRFDYRHFLIFVDHFTSEMRVSARALNREKMGELATLDSKLDVA
ncbi:hypothetical protein SCHPADRAFT_907787 [Schizopora paradoxa]|uniref:Uncharacterized protein n=1 Tax=Schizopora paradoxa TaxID=27342 RepID=A0A0H2RX50_9AGAM|nr:hypothetical protein SCHPADRAFT_907787 [Schizopora paradoxa]